MNSLLAHSPLSYNEFNKTVISLKQHNKKNNVYNPEELSLLNLSYVPMSSEQQDALQTLRFGPHSKVFERYISEKITHSNELYNNTYAVYLSTITGNKEPVGLFTLAENTLTCDFKTSTTTLPIYDLVLFAFDTRFQDYMLSLDNNRRPLSAWVLRNIVNSLVYSPKYYNPSCPIIVLNGIPSAINFYKKCGFVPSLINNSKNVDTTLMFRPVY